MRLIIAGPRRFNNQLRVEQALDQALETLLGNLDLLDRPQLLRVEGVLHGGARGVDTIGGVWAAEKGWPVAVMPYVMGDQVCQHCLAPKEATHCQNGCAAPWADRRLWGKIRNRLMVRRALEGVDSADVALLYLWDRMSGGTAHMVALCAHNGIRTYGAPLEEE